MLTVGPFDETSSLLEWAEAVDLLLQLSPGRRSSFIAHLAAEFASLGEAALPIAATRRWWRVVRVEYVAARVIGS